MPPHHRGNSGCRGVRARPYRTFSVEIRSGEMRLDLGTFDNPEDAARAYGAPAWSLRRPRREMNFSEVMMLEWAQRLPSPPRLVTEEDHR
ncbi:hypothetical protein D1007_15101 [Hordeum vulgare]|nr:hypothetical protein D1007_15101 [Hordeum vulgare]